VPWFLIVVCTKLCTKFSTVAKDQVWMLLRVLSAVVSAAAGPLVLTLSRTRPQSDFQRQRVRMAVSAYRPESVLPVLGLLQLRVLGFCLLQNGDVGVGVFPMR